MAAEQKIRNYGTVYQPGTAARALPKQEPRRKDEQKQKKQQIQKARREIEIRVSEKRRAANEFSRLQMLAIVACASVFIAAAAFFMMSVSVHDTVKNDIEKLELQVQTLHQDNRILQNIKNSSIDYSEVYTVATEVYGMRTPMKQQIVYYEEPEIEFVHKYGDIPK